MVRTTDSSVLIKAYKTYVRPLVESGTIVSDPYLNNDVGLLEGVQNNSVRKLVARCSAVYYRYISCGW